MSRPTSRKNPLRRTRRVTPGAVQAVGTPVRPSPYIRILRPWAAGPSRLSTAPGAEAGVRGGRRSGERHARPRELRAWSLREDPSGRWIAFGGRRELLERASRPATASRAGFGRPVRQGRHRTTSDDLADSAPVFTFEGHSFAYWRVVSTRRAGRDRGLPGPRRARHPHCGSCRRPPLRALGPGGRPARARPPCGVDLVGRGHLDEVFRFRSVVVGDQ